METKSMATLPPNSPPSGYRGIETHFTSDIGFLVSVSFVIIWAITASIYVFLPKQEQEHSFRHRPTHKAPCQYCRYFSYNPYLKCTIHPSTVLTEQAVDCLDYSPNTVTKKVKEE